MYSAVMKSLMKLGVADIPNDSPSAVCYQCIKPLLYYYYNCIINNIYSIYIHRMDPNPNPDPEPEPEPETARTRT
jgi:hypothetical protein